MSRTAIGIDLGTSFSCVAIVENGIPRVLPDADGNFNTPSVVAFGAGGQRLVGWKAKRQAVYNPEHTVFEFKRLIGRKFLAGETTRAREVLPYEIVSGPSGDARVRVEGQDYSIQELSSFVLMHMKEIAETHLSKKVDAAVVTVPAYFNDTQRQATKDAAEIAGLEVLRMINEPTAAALAYGLGKELSQRIVVYDLGGGTFDVSVLEVNGDIFEVIGTAGDTYLGGADIDRRIVEMLAQEFQQAHGLDPRTKKAALSILFEAAETAKIALSEVEQTAINIADVMRDAGGRSLAINCILTREKLAALAHDLIQRSFVVCDEALQGARISAGDIEEVVLVGGPTKLPIIRQAVEHYFQKQPHASVDPDLVVALGAAIQADTLANASSNAWSPSALLIDVTPLSLSVGTVGDFTERLIARNTPVPTEQTRTFTTSRDNQRGVRIRVYQGEGKRTTENHLLGEFELVGLRAAARGEVEIQVTFELDSNGILNVSARDMETNATQHIQVTATGGLSAEEATHLKATHATRDLPAAR